VGEHARALLIADAHVHVYPEFDVPRLLDAASANLAGAARTIGVDTPRAFAYLLLSETRSSDFFQRAAGGGADLGPWRPSATGEPESLRLEHPARPPLVLVAGRQVRTEEGLEVLALGTRATFRDGAPFDVALHQVSESAAITVLPWGLGKWWGRRGRTVWRAVADRLRSPVGRLALGDDGGRPRWTPRPSILRRGAAAGALVLRGSDPLPLPGQESRVGEVGFAVIGHGDPDRPLAALTGALDREGRPVRFGGGQGVASFLGDQLRLRIIRERGS
jgi:hypothetical protein